MLCMRTSSDRRFYAVFLHHFNFKVEAKKRTKIRTKYKLLEHMQKNNDVERNTGLILFISYFHCKIFSKLAIIDFRDTTIY